jgi:hypothetical protein
MFCTTKDRTDATSSKVGGGVVAGGGVPILPTDDHRVDWDLVVRGEPSATLRMRAKKSGKMALQNWGQKTKICEVKAT